MHLRNQGAAALASLDNLTPRDGRVRYFVQSVLLPDDLDGVGPGPVPGSHVPVLTIHDVGARPGVVSQPYAEVLDLEWLPLPDLLHGHELPELPQAGLGN